MSTLKANGGSGQTGAVGTILPRALSVKAIDAYSGNVISGITVTFNDGAAGGSFGNPTPVTGRDGVASTTYTLPGAPGAALIAITAPGFVSRVPYKETAQ